MKNKILLPLIALASLLSSCIDSETEIFPESEFFTSEDIGVLEQYLNLSANPLNYSNPDLPEHFKSEDAEETDNTPHFNEISNMGATLGRVLFYDKKLSANNTISCASCHKQNEGFSDSRKFSVGLNGEKTRRNSMSLINSRYYQNGSFFWDERARTLEDQVLMPIQDHIEMGLELDELVEKLQPINYYQILFRNAFGDSLVTTDRISLSLAQFTRSIVSYQSKFDEGLMLAGNPDVGEQMPLLPNFTEKENIGLDIFMRGRKGATCQYCHGTPQIIAFEARNNGLEKEYTDNGKGEITKNADHNAVFKAPSLRNIAHTAPYMHDGRFKTLMDVVNHYNSGVQQHPNLHFRLTTVDDGPLGGPPMQMNLTQEEKEALVAFLHTLTDESLVNDEKFSDPFK
jgi:cytochrome c peroxidase